MKYILVLFMVVSMSALAGQSEEADLLKAWEKLQAENPVVKSLVKVGERKYEIKFNSLPYEGELNILAVGFDDMARYGGDSQRYTLSGYVEYDLPNAPEDMQTKYGRTFYKWERNNALFFDSEENKWVSNEVYLESLSNMDYEDESRVKPYPSFVIGIFKYWNIILIFIIMYFFFTQIVNNRRVKESVELQRKMADENIKLHRKTNELLAEIKEELKRKET